MRHDPDHRPEGELSNKEETEVPIGEPLEATSREYSMWRCAGCGEMGRLTDDLPTSCPSCEGPREELYYWEED